MRTWSPIGTQRQPPRRMSPFTGKADAFLRSPKRGREWSLRGGFATVNNYRLPGEEGRFASEK
jgi:hypothetical protein